MWSLPLENVLMHKISAPLRWNVAVLETCWKKFEAETVKLRVKELQRLSQETFLFPHWWKHQALISCCFYWVTLWNWATAEPASLYSRHLQRLAASIEPSAQSFSFLFWSQSAEQQGFKQLRSSSISHRHAERILWLCCVFAYLLSVLLCEDGSSTAAPDKQAGPEPGSFT